MPLPASWPRPGRPKRARSIETSLPRVLQGGWKDRGREPRIRKFTLFEQSNKPTRRNEHQPVQTRRDAGQGGRRLNDRECPVGNLPSASRYQRPLTFESRQPLAADGHRDARLRMNPGRLVSECRKSSGPSVENRCRPAVVRFAWFLSTEPLTGRSSARPGYRCQIARRLFVPVSRRRSVALPDPGYSMPPAAHPW